MTLIIEIAVGVPSNHLAVSPFPSPLLQSPQPRSRTSLERFRRLFHRAAPAYPPLTDNPSVTPLAASFSSSKAVPWVNFAEEQPRDCARLIFNRLRLRSRPRSLASAWDARGPSNVNWNALAWVDGECPTDFICNEIGCVVTFYYGAFPILRRNRRACSLECRMIEDRTVRSSDRIHISLLAQSSLCTFWFCCSLTFTSGFNSLRDKLISSINRGDFEISLDGLTHARSESIAVSC